MSNTQTLRKRWHRDFDSCPGFQYGSPPFHDYPGTVVVDTTSLVQALTHSTKKRWVVEDLTVGKFGETYRFHVRAKAPMHSHP